MKEAFDANLLFNTAPHPISIKVWGPSGIIWYAMQGTAVRKWIG